MQRGFANLRRPPHRALTGAAPVSSAERLVSACGPQGVAKRFNIQKRQRTAFALEVFQENLFRNVRTLKTLNNFFAKKSRGDSVVAKKGRTFF